MIATYMSNVHILVVEDDFKSRKRLRDLPGAVGYKISQAACADEVIRL